MAKKAEEAPIKVLIVIGSLEIGGAERHVGSLATSLREYGIEVGICALSSSGPLARQLYEEDIRLFYPKQNNNSRLLSKIKGLRSLAPRLRSVWIFLQAYYFFRPNITHFFLPGAYIIGGLTSLFIPGLQRVMSRRSLNVYQQGKPLSNAIERFLHTKMDKITGNSQSVIKDLIAEGAPEEKLKLIYNGVYVPDRLKGMENGFFESVEILCIANLIPYKGHLDLLEALARIPKVVSWHLTCVGRDDNYQVDLESAISRLGLQGFVDFAGVVLDPLPYLLKADIGINCSHQEGFSNAILEYMALGLGIVVTDVGGNAEAIRHQLDGIVVPSREPSEMAAAITALFEPRFRKRLGGSARQRAIDTFGTKKCIECYVDMYRDLKKG